MSRPYWSVPNQNSGAGSRSRVSVRRYVGSTLPRYGAAWPVARMSERQASLATRVDWRRRKHRRAAPGSGAVAAAIGAAPAAARSVADAGVEEDIQDVDDQVQEHVDARDDEDHALDHRVVPPDDRVDGEPSDAWQSEDALRHHRPADEEGEAHADDGHDRQRSRLESVAQQDAPWRQTLGEG